ncbi:MAG: helix-turn-helix transcriptional regulator [Flavobacteriales bacterium]|nr:helix-turn-helix transcriptional regulator [Flavobacteriales bacterium]
MSEREREVLELILQEHTSKQIAEKLFISKQTVDSHRLRIMEKTGARTLVGLIKHALANGML